VTGTDSRPLYFVEEGGCPHYRDPATCVACEAESRAVRSVRYLAAQYLDAANEAARQLERLAGLHAELKGNPCYRDFYRYLTDDEDSMAAISDAAHTIRSVTRIAQARLARTRQEKGGA
jgi:hypothetical protein